MDPYEWQNHLERLIQRGAQSSAPASSYPLLSEIATSQTLPNWTSGGSNPFDSRRRRLDDLITPPDANASNVLDSNGGSHNRPPSWSPFSLTHSAPSPPDGDKGGPGRQQGSSALNTVCSPAGNEFRRGEGDDFSHDDESDGLSQLGHLSIDDNRDVRYHGRTSGLHLLASASARAATVAMQSDKPDQHPQSTGRLSPKSSAADNFSDLVQPSLPNDTFHKRKSSEDAPGNFFPSTSHKGGIWYFPRSGVWPPVDLSKERHGSTQSPSSGSRDASYSPGDYAANGGARDNSPSDHQSWKGSSVTDGVRSESLQGRSSSLRHTVSPAAPGRVSWFGDLCDPSYEDGVDLEPQRMTIPTFIEEKDMNLEVLRVSLPPRERLDELMTLYWKHVHPVLPAVHKAHFQRSYQAA